MAKARAASPANLAIWNQLKDTPQSATKPFNKSGFKGTAIVPNYVAERLTEIFGPCGVGWTFEVTGSEFVTGHTLASGDRCIIHVLMGHLAYRDPVSGERFRTGQQFGQTTFVGENKNGTFTDEEAPKKSVTDCITKCAAMLGLAADIFSGAWDSNKWVNDRSNPAASSPTPALRTVPRKQVAATDAAFSSLGKNSVYDEWALSIAAALSNAEFSELYARFLDAGYAAPELEEGARAFADKLREDNDLLESAEGQEVLEGLQVLREELTPTKKPAVAKQPAKVPRKKAA